MISGKVNSQGIEEQKGKILALLSIAETYDTNQDSSRSHSFTRANPFFFACMHVCDLASTYYSFVVYILLPDVCP
jgi:hypothetical protein